MFEAQSFLAFLATSTLLIFAPGPDMLLVISRGFSQGSLAAIVSALGATTGIFVHTCLAAFGMSVLLQTSKTLFLVVKLVGAVYLIYLGIKLIQDKPNSLALKQQMPVSMRVVYAQGVFSSVLNPKLALFILAFLPQFVSSPNHSTIQIIILGLILGTQALMIFSLIGIFSSNIATLFIRNSQFSNYLRIATGGTLAFLGLNLAV
ncbi:MULTISPECIES: LysE family translocator [Nostocales]|uniref:LysE family translocator n=3 Tax=Nostocales TaxID=1161 RepID=A0A0C1QNW1_9CYAN|nr:LysE family translocator [Tolypothrix bouteillei]KAF3889374.1 LysE family translocator [Tolypothrix bouteillei VB521301]